MSGIEELHARVADAVEHFSLIDEQRAASSQRLIDLMNTVEGRIRDQLREIEEHKSGIAHHSAEIESQSAEVGRIDRENEQLRAMLHALLQAIEGGGRDDLADTLQELERKASSLIDDGTAQAPLAEEIAGPIAEAPAKPAAEIEVPDSEALDEIEEPVLAEDAIGAGGVLDSAEISHDPIADDSIAEEIEASAAEAEEPAAAGAGSGSLDEIMARVSELVQETEVAIAASEPVAEAPEDPAEESAQQAAAGS